MFHYCTFAKRRLLFAAYLHGSSTPKAQPSAATKSTNKDEQGRLSTTDAAPILDSALFVAIRPLSWLFAFTLTESFLCTCDLACKSGILLMQCSFQRMNVHPNWSR